MRFAVLRRQLRVTVATLVAIPAGAKAQDVGPPEPASVSSHSAESQPSPEDGLAAELKHSILVSRFVVRFPLDEGRNGLPSPAEIERVIVRLGETPQARVRARHGLPVVERPLVELDSDPPIAYTAGAIQDICGEIVRHAREAHGLIGVFAAPDAAQVRFRPGRADDQGREVAPPSVEKDLREDDTTLTIDVAFADVQQVRSLAAGERFAGADHREDHDAHARIRRLSPLKGPASEPEIAQGPPEPPPRGDPLDRRALDRYVYRLNRHPGRRVDVAVANADSQGGAVLDYLVAENKPWTIFGQLSNTGTDSTREWRERFGFYHNQLTDRDDTLSIDFITAALDESNALLASYEAPWFDTTGLRWRLNGSASEFTAADVGQARDTFTGESWSIGGELSGILYQRDDLFVDLFAGGRYERIRVQSEVNATEGDTPVFYPYVGLRLDHATERTTTFATVALEWMTPDLAGTDPEELQELGRSEVDEEWTTFRWDLSHSTYLEPLIGGPGWEARYREGLASLAHEVAVSLRGQHTFDSRVIPQAEAVAGGLYTVRGYPESAVAGDNAIMGTIEYRLHYPRLLAPYGPDDTRPTLFGSPFNARSPSPGARPDWDLILRAFLDAARVTSNNKVVFERDDTLIGAGVGVELLLRRNLSLRFDWGWALNEVERDDGDVVEQGDHRLHVVGTLLF